MEIVDGGGRQRGIGSVGEVGCDGAFAGLSAIAEWELRLGVALDIQDHQKQYNAIQERIQSIIYTCAQDILIPSETLLPENLNLIKPVTVLVLQVQAGKQPALSGSLPEIPTLGAFPQSR